MAVKTYRILIKPSYRDMLLEPSRSKSYLTRDLINLTAKCYYNENVDGYTCT